jgi:hypothetical protein
LRPGVFRGSQRGSTVVADLMKDARNCEGAVMTSYGVIASVLSIALLSQTAHAQTRPAAPRTPPPALRPMSPLDARRSAYLDDRSGTAGAREYLQRSLRERHLWTLIDRREAADLIVTLAQVQTSQRRQPLSYELTIQPARNATRTPLWRAVSSSPQKLVSRLKADLAPSVCVAVWCW